MPLYIKYTTRGSTLRCNKCMINQSISLSLSLSLSLGTYRRFFLVLAKIYLSLTITQPFVWVFAHRWTRIIAALIDLIITESFILFEPQCPSQKFIRKPNLTSAENCSPAYSLLHLQLVYFSTCDCMLLYLHLPQWRCWLLRFLKEFIFFLERS